MENKKVSEKKRSVKTPTKEIIKLAQKCGANPDEAVRKYNQEIQEEKRTYKEKNKKNTKRKTLKLPSKSLKKFSKLLSEQ